MSWRKIVFLMTTALMLCAGVVLGRLWAQLPAAKPQQGQGPSWIADQLNLTAEQRQQMDAVWAVTKQKLEQSSDQRHDADKQRDTAVMALLTTPQQTAYEKIMSDYRDKRSQLDKDRESLIQDAEARSRALLDDSQKARWDELTKQMHLHHGPPHWSGSPDTRPATAGDDKTVTP
jgi:Spy/CpxP family protein refolding chaperone